VRFSFRTGLITASPSPRLVRILPCASPGKHPLGCLKKAAPPQKNFESKKEQSLIRGVEPAARKMVLWILLICCQSAYAQSTSLDIVVDLAKNESPLVHYWERCVGSGHGALTMREDWRQHVAMAHKDLGIQVSRHPYSVQSLTSATFYLGCKLPEGQVPWHPR
jgi:hypothetical protein